MPSALNITKANTILPYFIFVFRRFNLRPNSRTKIPSLVLRMTKERFTEHWPDAFAGPHQRAPSMHLSRYKYKILLWQHSQSMLRCVGQVPPVCNVVEVVPGEIFTVESATTFFGVPLSLRMVVVVLEDKELLLYSPVLLTEEVQQFLHDLGTVRYLVAPNKLHNVHLTSYLQVYPKAKLYVPPGLAERCPELVYDAVLGPDPEPAWSSILDQALCSGSEYWAEVLLYHRRLRILIVGDFIENFYDMDLDTTTLRAKLASKLFNVCGIQRYKPSISPENSIFVLYPETWLISLRKLLGNKLDGKGGWDVQTIFMCHGRPMTGLEIKYVLVQIILEAAHSYKRRWASTRLFYAMLGKWT